MTTNFFAPYPHHDAPTVVRTPAVDMTTTWRGGWIVSGFAALLAVAALGAVGGVALDLMAESTPAAAPVATFAPAPVLVAPAVTISPTVPAPAMALPTRTIHTTRIVVVPAPSEPVVPAATPVVTPPTPLTPPAPPLGIGTCDLVACDPKPVTPPAPPTNCGIVACHPLPQAPKNPLPRCGDLVACETPAN